MDDQQIKAIVEGVTRKVDERLGEAFHAIDERLERHTNANLAAHEEHRQGMNAMRRNIITLWRHVRGPGSDPPADGSGEIPTVPPEGLEAKTSAVDLEVDALRAEMITGFASVEKKLEVATAAQTTTILAKVDKATENPIVKKWGERLLVAIVTAILAALAQREVPAPQVPAAHAQEVPK